MSLIFKYAMMNTSKTANLLMTAHSLSNIRNKVVVLVKPAIDDRNGKDIIFSRIGLKATADIVLEPNNFPLEVVVNQKNEAVVEEAQNLIKMADIILVDEAQFLSIKNVEKLRELASKNKISIVCYGLLTDYRSKLFFGSKRLIELADVRTEITNEVSIASNCSICHNSKAIINSKFIDHNNGCVEIIKNGSSLPDIGSEEKYRPLCWNCWTNA